MRILFGIIIALLLATGNACADMAAVSVDLAKILSSPSDAGSRVTVLVPRYYPLHILEAQGEFYKVNDFRNNSGWVSKATVDNTRTIVVNTTHINVRQGPGSKNPVVFRAEKGVAFKVISEEGDWLQVEHANGMKGWLFKNLVWGE